MKFKEIINEFIEFAKINIADLAQKEIANEEKKAKLDKAMTAYLIMIADRTGFGIIKFIISKIIVKNIPTITQAIYDLIKFKLDGITK